MFMNNLQIFRTSELARRVGLTAITVRRLAARGVIRSQRVGGGWRVFTEEDVNRVIAFMARRKNGGRPKKALTS